MEKPIKKTPSRITGATVGRSTFSFLIDLGFTLGMMFILYYAIGRPLIMNQNDYYPAIDEQTSYVTSSRLLEVKDKGDFSYFAYEDTEATAPEDYAYKKYLGHMWDYFMVALPENSLINPNNKVTSTISGEEIPGYEGTPDRNDQNYGKWVYRYYFGYVETATEHSFVPSIEGDFTSKPVAGKDETRYHYALKMELFDNGTSPFKGHYVDAVAHLSTQPKLAEYSNRIRLAQYAATIPSFVGAPIIFFFIIPLCIPNGRTLGKLFLGVAVIDFDGYKASRFQIIVRQAIITFLWLVLALPWQVVAMPLFTLLMLVDYMVRVLSKKGQAIHDMLMHTLSVDARKSVWFASEEEEKEFVEQHPHSPVSKALKAQAEEEKQDVVAATTSAMIEAEEKILDLSTINKRREEARRMTSFDEFEKKSDEEFAKREEEAAARQQEEDDSAEVVDPEAEEQALKDLAKLEGYTEEDVAAMNDGADEDEDPDAFVDEKK